MQRAAPLDDTISRQMREAAEDAYPNEACGLVIGEGRKARLIVCKNSAADPSKTFRIDASDYARAEDEGEVLAIWHSHVDEPATPSDADRAGCEASQLPWLISSIDRTDGVYYVSEPTTLEPSGFQMPYLERPYIFGTFDCFSLVVDYYEREFGITIERFEELREPEWWRQGKDFFGDHYASQGFVSVTDESWQEGDVLLFAVNSTIPNHVAIYVTGDIILHHMINRLSCRETCGVAWHSRMTHHLRHTSKC